MQGIKVNDYLKSIRTRVDACRAVIYDECTTIEEAIKTTNKIQRIREFEQGLNGVRSSNKASFSSIRKLSNKDLSTWKMKTNFQVNSDKFNNGLPREYPLKSITNSIPVLANQTLKCFRCKESGHKVIQCPYSDEELIEILSKRVRDKNDEVKNKKN